jgi:hypothetical protein
MTSKTVSTTINGTYTLGDSDDLTVTSSGTMNAASTEFVVVDSGAIGTLTNDGDIGGGGGIMAASIASLTNANLIVSDRTGSASWAAVSKGTLGALANFGRILAINYDILTTGSIGTVTNSGTLDSLSGTVIYDHANLTSLDNAVSGVISGDVGIDVALSIGTLTNEGSISASSGAAIEAASITTLTNSGNITGGQDGIFVTGSVTSLDNAAGATITGSTDGIEVDGSAGTITNAGAINGGPAGAGIAVRGAVTIVNSGAIFGGVNTVSIALGSQYATVVIDPTSRIGGFVEDLSCIGGTLVLGGSGANTVTQMGTQFTGFATVSSAPEAALSRHTAS